MNKKGFTLVELLAVIAILALLVIIALPNVLSMFNSAKKDIFLTEAKNIYKEVSKKYISESMKGNKITKISNDKNKLDLESSNLEYGISLDNEGKVKYFQVSDGTYCISGKISNLSELTIDKISDGKCKEYDYISPEPIYCTYDGSLYQGATYVNGQYTYKFLKEGISSSSGLGWTPFSQKGWGVQLTDKTSTEAVTSKVCTYINDIPVVSMSSMFEGSQAISIDLSSFNTSNVINMQSMFSSVNATSIDLSNLNTSKVTNMSYMFRSSQATTLDLSNFDTSNVLYMGYMFYNSKTEVLDVSNFDTSNVRYMNGMFNGSKGLIKGLENFDTSNVTTMQSMFFLSKSALLDVSNFDTGKVTNMSYMFDDTSATTIDVSNFDTSKVTNMQAMFYGVKVTSLDLSNFDTSKVKDMSYMFSHASNLKTIYASDKFKTDAVTSDNYIFNYCSSLVGGAGTKHSAVTITYARIDGGTSSPGYFTSK